EGRGRGGEPCPAAGGPGAERAWAGIRGGAGQRALGGVAGGGGGAGDRQADDEDRRDDGLAHVLPAQERAPAHRRGGTTASTSTATTPTDRSVISSTCARTRSAT